jgi:DNA-binding GntR family transcriptional regulator
MAKAAQKAYELVRDRIINGEYASSLRLTEQEIADASGVSRTPVREALQRLQNEGYIRVSANQGAVVIEWSENDANDVFELRALLEPYGAARAARRITREGIEDLHQLAVAQYEECRKRAPGFVERVGILNSRFHRTLHSFAESPRLSMLMPMLIEAPLVMRTFTDYDADELLRSASHHLEIVQALQAGDADWAEAIMRSHIHAAQYSIRRNKQDSGQRGSGPELTAQAGR